MTNVTIVTSTVEVVKICLARSTFPSPIAIEYNVPPPTPMSKEMEIISVKTGTAILTLARATEPIPFPTKIPSTTMLIDINIIPSNVGMKYWKKLLATDCSLNLSFRRLTTSHPFTKRSYIFISKIPLPNVYSSSLFILQKKSDFYFFITRSHDEGVNKKTIVPC